MNLASLRSPTETAVCRCGAEFTRRAKRRGRNVSLECPSCRVATGLRIRRASEERRRVRKLVEREKQQAAYQARKAKTPWAMKRKEAAPNGPRPKDGKLVKLVCRCGKAFEGNPHTALCCGCSLKGWPPLSERWANGHPLCKD